MRAELWAILPSAPDSPSEFDPMELLRAVGEAIGRSVTAGHWPGLGPTDEHLTEIAHNLSRARHLVERTATISSKAAPEIQRDIQDLHGQVMHTLYVAAHGTAVALRMTPRTFVSTSRSTIQLFRGGSEVAGGRLFGEVATLAAVGVVFGVNRPGRLGPWPRWRMCGYAGCTTSPMTTTVSGSWSTGFGRGE